MEKVAITLSYKQAHGIMAGVGALFGLMGTHGVSEDFKVFGREVVGFTGDGQYESERADESADFQVTKMNLDVLVSGAAMLYTLTNAGMIKDSPHTLEDIAELGNYLSKVLLENWPEMATPEHRRAMQADPDVRGD